MENTVDDLMIADFTSCFSKNTFVDGKVGNFFRTSLGFEDVQF